MSKEMSKEMGIPAYKIEKVINAFIKFAIKQIMKGQKIRLKGLFSAAIEVQPSRARYNVLTEEYYNTPKKFALKISASSKLKKEVNEKKIY